MALRNDLLPLSVLYGWLFSQKRIIVKISGFEYFYDKPTFTVIRIRYEILRSSKAGCNVRPTLLASDKM